MRTLEEVREFMYQDTYAVETTGITIEEIDEDGCVYLRMPIDERHYNGIGRVMGGAIFTLADFAVASTIYANEILTTAISSSIEFMAAGQGAYLTAKGHLDKAGKKGVAIGLEEGAASMCSLIPYEIEAMKAVVSEKIYLFGSMGKA